MPDADIGDAAEQLPVEYPATGEVLCRLQVADASVVDAAVQGARAAGPAWAALSGAERGRVLLAAARLLRERRRAVAEAEVWDTGKPHNTASSSHIA